MSPGSYGHSYKSSPKTASQASSSNILLVIIDANAKSVKVPPQKKTDVRFYNWSITRTPRNELYMRGRTCRYRFSREIFNQGAEVLLQLLLLLLAATQTKLTIKPDLSSKPKNLPSTPKPVFHTQSCTLYFQSAWCSSGQARVGWGFVLALGFCEMPL